MAEIKEAKISDLVFDDKNFNKHTEYGMSLIEKSIRNNGAGRSILIDKNNRIIAGNGVTEIAGQIGLEDVQIVESDGSKIIAVKRTDIDLDSKQGREMALADNATASVDLAWDEEQIQFAEEEFGMVAEEWGVNLDFETEQPTATEDDFDESTDAITTRCNKGDVWLLGEHRLMCGDSTSADDVEKLMDGAKADMVFTDPPYGVSYADKNEYLNSLGKPMSCPKRIENDSHPPQDMYDFWRKAFKLLHENTKDCMAYYITAPQGGDLLLLLLLLQAVRDSGFMLKHQLIWNKNNHVLGRCDYNYKHEPIIYGWKIGGTHKFYGEGKFKTSVWDIAKPLQSKLHPTMKPIELIEECLLDCSTINDSVLDLFGGSGSTLIACEQLNRKCFMMELDPHYCDVIIARWEKLTGKNARRITDGI